MLLAGMLSAALPLGVSAQSTPLVHGEVAVQASPELAAAAQSSAPTFAIDPVILERDLAKRSDPFSGKSFSLDDCIRVALDRNIRIRASGYEVQAARGQLTEANAQFWPVLEYKYRVAPVPTDASNAFNSFFDGEVTLFQSIRVGIGMPIMTFGQLLAVKNMATGGVQAARIREAQTREQTISEVKKLYYGILLAREVEGLLADAADRLHNKIKGEAEKKARFDEAEIAGEELPEEEIMDPYDNLQLKLFHTDLQRRLAETRENIELAREGLRIQMGLMPDEPLELEMKSLKAEDVDLAAYERYFDTGLDTMPELKLVDVGVEVKRQQYRLERFKLAPRMGVGFFVDVGRAVGPISGITSTDDYNNPFNYTRAGVGIEVKGSIDVHGSLGRIRKSRAEYYKASVERLLARRAAGLDLRKAYLNVKRARKDLDRAADAKSMAQQMMFLSKINYDMGLEEDQQKYADALKIVLLTRGQYYKAIFSYNVALAELAKRVGEAKHDELSASGRNGVFSEAGIEQEAGSAIQGEGRQFMDMDTPGSVGAGGEPVGAMGGQ